MSDDSIQRGKWLRRRMGVPKGPILFTLGEVFLRLFRPFLFREVRMYWLVMRSDYWRGDLSGLEIWESENTHAARSHMLMSGYIGGPYQYRGEASRAAEQYIQHVESYTRMRLTNDSPRRIPEDHFYWQKQIEKVLDVDFLDNP